MKTIDLSAEKMTLRKLLGIAAEGNVMLKTSEGREFVIFELDELETELPLIQQNQELMALLQQRSQETKTYSLYQAREKLSLE